MTKFTKERLEEIAELARKATYKPCSMHMTNLLVVCDSEVIEEMARQLLASMEQEPVACIDRANLDYLESGADADVWPASGAGSDDVLLYAAPQLPQPAVLSVSEGVLKSLLPDVEKSEFWFEHNGKIFFEGVRFNNAVFEACRAAMLQAGNSPVIPDDVLRMDWLVSKTVDVREPMVYGSHSIFWSQTITDEYDDYHATKLRGQIDAAMAAEQAAAPQQEVRNGR